jgi:calcineurin-like phosphoesterase family protein
MTFLGLLPVRHGLFALESWTPSAPLLFTAVPYVQPGPASGALAEGQESVVIAWQTEQRAADFVVEYGATPKLGRRATIAVTTRAGAKEKEGEGRINYAATLAGLHLGARYHYRVRLGDGKVIADGYGTTRKARGTAMRFVAFGDNSYGEIGQRQIAYWAYRARPDFVMNTGDNVYDNGRDDEYQRYFFPIYNADIASPGVGAPLLRSVPFYTVLANHDVHGKDANGHPAADFDLNADALGYFTNMYLPLNGPTAPPQPMPIAGAAARQRDFTQCAGERFPRMGNYSFDYGDAHFLCLDSNTYVDPTDAGWRSYIESDLGSTDARWKFVVYHHPAFNVGQEHYTEQHMRVLSPIFEAHHVDFVLSGHEHNYQRTRPLRFAPHGAGRAAERGQKDRRVPGAFQVDGHFDGHSATRADGVQYITTGAGGRHLYDPTFTDAPDTWLREDDDRVAYVARVISDRHSFTMFDIDGPRLTMTQVDQWGHEVDRVHVSKEMTRLTSS